MGLAKKLISLVLRVREQLFTELNSKFKCCTFKMLSEGTLLKLEP